MFFVEASGTPYEIGCRVGAATKLAIGAALDLVGRRFRHWDAAKFEQARRRHMAYTETHLPSLAEELRGVADGSGFSFQWIYLVNCYASLRAAAAGCSNIIFTETPDGPLLGKANDRPATEPKLEGLCLVRPKGGMALLAVSWPGTVWFSQGINEAGLALGASSCSATLPAPDAFFNVHLQGRYVLSRCETTAQAIALMKTITASAAGANWALVDAAGDAAVVEQAGTLTGVRRPEGKRLWCTNHALTPELVPYGKASDTVLRESRDRFDAIGRLTAQCVPGLAALRRILAFTGQPGALCRYRENDPVNYETEFAFILRPADGVMEACFSHADRDPWRVFRMAGGACRDPAPRARRERESA